MTFNNYFYLLNKQRLRAWLMIFISLSLLGCNTSSDDDSGTGYIQLYNLSSNAPNIYLTVDKYDDEDYEENNHSGVPYTYASSRFSYEADTYDIELAWQSEYNSQYNVETVYENQLKINSYTVELVVITDDIKAPKIFVYELPVRDDDELTSDSYDEIFNIRVLNMHTDFSGVDMYYSLSDETFNEAVLLSQTSYSQLSDNQKIAQNDYIFYLTEAGSTQVLFTSEDMSFPYAAEYTMVIRGNTGVGSSPFMLDKLSTSSIVQYADANAEASYRVYNGIIEHSLLADYQNSFDFYINGIDDLPEVPALNFGEFSTSNLIESGDYSMSIISSSTQSPLLKNHLLALTENTDKTIFFYLLEEAVDEDGDGDIDEDGNGTIDQTKITINSLVVANSQSTSIYSHKMTVINLIDQDEIIDDFSSIKVYFVKNDEIIDTAAQYLTANFATPSTVELLNNTYTVYVIGKLDTSNIILSTTELVLNEDSKDQFILLEKDENSATGYKVTFANQSAD